MTLQRTALILVVALIVQSISAVSGSDYKTQPDKTYQQMSLAERSTFIATQVRRIARDISGREYEFTPAFEEEIQQALNSYIRRMDGSNKRDPRIALERGRAHAPIVTATFRARNLSPLLGLYIAFVESEFENIEAPNGMGAIGMFQFLPGTGQRYGLSTQDLLDVPKSADAAARYIADGIDTFKHDPMKEALALLAYNRGTRKTRGDLELLVNDQNRQCSICALSAGRSKLDETFRQESVFYVPRFFAAAIIGENPQAFGLQMQPLSSC